MSGFMEDVLELALSFAIVQIAAEWGRFKGRQQAIRDVARKNPDAIAAVEEQQLKDDLKRWRDYE